MAAPHAADEAGIRQLIGKLAEAIRAMDFEGLKACFAPDMVSFDVGGPPLQAVGARPRLPARKITYSQGARPGRHVRSHPAKLRVQRSGQK